MQGIKFTTETFVVKLEELFGTKLNYSKVIYKDHITPVIVNCEKHGDVLVKPKQLLHAANRFGCSSCGKEARKKLASITAVNNGRNSFKAKASLKHNNKFNYSKVNYVNGKTKVIITCPIHGDFLQVPALHLLGDGCKKCATEQAAIKYKKSFVQFIEDAKKVHGDKYTYSEDSYTGGKNYTSVTCKKHGAFLVTPTNHVNHKSGCPRCATQISSHEFKLSKVFPEFTKTNKQVIKPYHLDLYSEEHKLAIEVNGRLWHSEKYNKSKEYHLMKTKLCLDVGVSLLHFWDDEIVMKFDIVESMINSRLGKTSKIQARKTKVIVVDKATTKLFLDENHLQGNTNHQISYGLEHNGELISVMTFGKPRFTKDRDYEIIRFASKLNSTVVGGASKLFFAFVEAYKPSSIITYADRRYSEGGLYKILGFELSHNAPPNYFYAKDMISVSRYSAQKHKLQKLLGDKFDPELSEYDNMSKVGYYRVYDCGNKVFVWNRPVDTTKNLK